MLGATADEKLGADIKKEDEFTTIEDIDESKPKLLLPYELEGLSPENFEDATNKKTISPVTEETAELTTGDRIANAAIGGAIGLAVGGAVLATGGAAGAVAVGWKSVIDILGITSAQSFAIGSLAYDLVGMVLPIFFAVEMEPIEYSD